MAYCTESEIKQRLDINSATYDGMLGQLANVASDWIDAHCMLPQGAFAVTADTTRYYDPSALSYEATLKLDQPIVSVTTLVNGDGVTLSGAAYRLHPRNASPYWSIRLLSGYAWQFGIDGEIAVTGKFGWSLTRPKPVQEAAIMLSGWLFKRYQAALQDATVNLDLGQLVYSDPIPKQVTMMLAPFRAYGKML